MNCLNPLLGITEVLNDVTVGEYDVIVTAGKAFASRRREAVEGMMKFAQNFPQQAPLVADLMIKNMDVPGGEVMADRIKRSLPPQVVNDPDSPEGQQAAQAAQAQQQQAQQMQQQMLQSHIQTEQGKNQAAQAKASAEVTKAQAEVVKAHTDVQVAAIEAQNTKLEHVGKVLDTARMGQENLPPNQPQAVQNPVNNPIQPPQTQPQGAQIILAKHPDDVAREQQQAESTELLKQGIGAIAQHLAQAHQTNQEHTNTIHQLLAHIAQGNEAIGQHLDNQNKIASAPVEAIRDKTGRIVGSRKVM